jgi:two-component system heavy metal sensor histidine kinase CusS
MKSLRGRLIIRTLAACAACFVAAGIVLYFSQRSALIKEFDRGLEARAAVIMSVTEESSRGVHFEEPVDQHAVNRKDVFQMWTADGTLIAKSPALGSADLQREKSDKAVFVQLPNSTRARQRTFSFAPRPDEDPPNTLRFPAHKVVLTLARDTRDLDRELARTAWLIAMVLGLAALGAIAVMWPAVSAGLIPVAALAQRIGAARGRELSDRIELTNAPAELVPVVTRLNELLEAIEISFQREKAFTADVAHELRTPIGGLETALEVCAQQPRTEQEYRQVVDKCLVAARQMHRLIEQLLLLARAEGRQVRTAMHWENVQELLQENWHAVGSRATERKLRLEWDVPDNARLWTDRALFTVVVRNILDNAVSYADEGGSLLVRWEIDDDTARLIVANSGCTLAPVEVAKVFERFWRTDAARSATGRHAGLGLSLCEKIMPLLGGRALARIRDGNIFEIELSFPGNYEKLSQIPASGMVEAGAAAV